MKTTYYSILAAAACGMAFGTTAYTTPVGYISLGDTTAGEPAIKANTDVTASLPLLNTAEFSGTISSVNGSVITLSGSPALTTSPTSGSFAPDTGVPYIIQIGSGSKNGLVALVMSNTSTTLTVAVQSGDSLSGVVNGDAITVRKATTVSSLFANSTVPAGTQVLGFSGAVPGVNLAADLIFEFDGTDWIDTNSFEAANNVALYPGESFVIRNTSASPISSLVVSGEVNMKNSRTVLPASEVQQDIAFSFFTSTGENIGTSGLGAVSVAGDSILVFDNNTAGYNKAAANIIEYDGSAWIDTNSFEDVSTTFKFEPGVGYFLRAAASSDRAYSNQPDYIPSL